MNTRFLAAALALALPFLSPGCQTPSRHGIMQVATIDALLAGVYDGHLPLKALRQYGDFGIGTFAGLDGELILLDGKFYKVRADGNVYRPTLSERTPFACVTRFIPTGREKISDTSDQKALEEKINALAPEPNRFCAFRLRGEFTEVHTRSVPVQHKPYPPLAEVTKNQPTFTLFKVRGTLIGFRAPAFVKGINVPGYHMHFLADDLSGGGHVLEFELEHGVLEVDTTAEWLNIYLPPQSKAFNEAALARDRTAELNAVEKTKIGGKF